MRLSAAGFVPLLLLTTVPPAVSQERTIYRNLCIDIPIVVEWQWPIRIPVGCEVIDCCPGCPGPPPLEWRINFQGERLHELNLVAEDPAFTKASNIRVEGAGRRQQRQIVLRAGRTQITGLQADAKRPLVFSVAAPRPSKAGAPRAVTTTGTADAADAGSARLEIEQLMGGVVVDKFTLIYRWRWCRGFHPLPTDKIAYGGTNTGGDNTIVLLDARRPPGCVNDEVDRGTGPVTLGDVRANAGCRSEVTAFSDDNAVWLGENVATWTDPLGDVLNANLGALVNAPVDVWVMAGGFAATQARVTTDAARANQLYNTMNCGISTTVTVNDATADPDTPGLLDAACGNAANLRNSIGFAAGRVNAYYLRNPGARGWWCGNNTVIVGTGADNESFAHELGHAFTLGHTNGIAGFGPNNLMITGGVNRDQISIGQCFRCSLNGGSTLNGNGERTGPTRNCPDATTDAVCPDLALDVTPR